ncbi:hypothetical protein CSKR_112760 [Clonorchis sinensis]|uniref:Uncharacterized protein n=1 Tax=Clonorchis sinensis TaxID=79923 RepID=A0A3R7FSN7_CLOSI|nr:hypothetical protein CSKR_112760 [Clonorchis sinensis]
MLPSDDTGARHRKDRNDTPTLRERYSQPTTVDLFCIKVATVPRSSVPVYMLGNTTYWVSNVTVILGKVAQFTDRKVRGSNPTSASRLPLSTLRQPALVQPSGSMAVRHQKVATAERYILPVTINAFRGGQNNLSTSETHCASAMITKVILGIAQSLRCQLTDRKVHDLNQTSASRLLLPRLGQPGSIPALVPPSVCMADRHRKGATAERYCMR